MKKYIVKKDIKFIKDFGLKRGDELRQTGNFGDNYDVENYLFFNLPKEVVENNQDCFIELN